MQITRRSALRGGTATVAAIAVTGAVVARVAVDDPVVALERQWQAINAIDSQMWKDYRAQYDKLPAWAKLGSDGHGGGSGLSDISDLPEFKGRTGPGRLPLRPTLQVVEGYNRWTEAEAAHDPQCIAKAKAEGRARVQAWENRHQERDALEKELGIDDIDGRLEPNLEQRDAIEYEITDTPAASVAGIAVKLRLFAHHTDSEAGDFVHDFVLSALRDAERLAGRALS